MQIKKNKIREKILLAAKDEFLKKGYMDSSLNSIARSASLTKGSIYIYFKNKDTLFSELVKPVVQYIEAFFQPTDIQISNQIDEKNDWFKRTMERFKYCAEIVLENSELFRLLLFGAAGSSFNNYRETIIQHYSKNFKHFLGFFTKEQSPDIDLISGIFIHSIAAIYVNFLEEIVLHEPDKAEIEQYAEQMAVFVHSGIKTLYLYEKNRHLL